MSLESRQSPASLSGRCPPHPPKARAKLDAGNATQGAGVRLFRSTFAIAFFTFLSRIAGFLRDVLMAAFLGTGASADAFFIAWRLANIGRALFAEGMLNAAFVPMFSRQLTSSGFATAHAFANVVLNWMLVVLLGVSLLAEIFMPVLVFVFAPGFGAVPGKSELAILFSRIAFPYLLLISLVMLLSGALNSLGRFWLPAAVPILLNVAMIAALLLASMHSADPALFLSWSFPLAGVLQLVLILAAARRAGLRWRLGWPRPDGELGRMLRLFLPVALTGLIEWGVLVATSALASFQESAISWLQYAGRLYNLPVGMIAVSIGIVLLPELSRHFRGSDRRLALESQNRALEFALLLTVPAAVVLFLLPDMIINVLFERARFTAADTRATAAALGVMALGLPAGVVQHILTIIFYARQDTKTPLLVGIVANAVFVLAAFGFFPWLGYVSIAVGGSLAAWTNAILLGLLLRRDGHMALDARLRRRMGGLLVSGAVMFALLWFLHQGGALAPLAAELGDGLVARAAVLFLLLGIGGLVYAVACQLSGAAHWRELLALALPRHGNGKDGNTGTKK